MLTFEIPLVRLRITNQVEFAEPKELQQTKRVLPMARSLALGYRIVRAVESGEVEGYREVARRMGVSHTRVSVLVALTSLSPRIQEAILMGADDQLGFHTLLRIARTEDWRTQEAMAEGEIRRQRLWGANSRMGDLQAGSGPDSRPKDSQNGGSRETIRLEAAKSAGQERSQSKRRKAVSA